MSEKEINDKLDEVFQKVCSQPCPIQCVAYRNNEVWLLFRQGIMNIEKYKNVFLSVGLVIFEEFKDVTKIHGPGYEYSRIELEKDLLIARAKLGV